MANSWRDSARPVIAMVLAETDGQDDKAIRKALHDAYPFGVRAMHPYKIWLDEIKRQRHLKIAAKRLSQEVFSFEERSASGTH